jgi:tol-pal system protein YbgF
MTHMPLHALKPVALAALLSASAVAAEAQQGAPTADDAGVGRLEALRRDTSSFFSQVFGGSSRSEPLEMAQASPSELVVRLDRLENQVRQLTGLVEQLQYRNQQLELQLRRMQDPGGLPPTAGLSSNAGPPPAGGPPLPTGGLAPPARPQTGLPPPSGTAGLPPPPPQRRSDVFDPNENPSAPGAPRTLGTLPGGPTVIPGAPNDEPVGTAPIGVPGGRQAGAPLDLSTLSGQASNDSALPAPGGAPTGMSSPLPPPPPRSPSATGGYQQQSMLPPNATSKDEYDLAYGYLLRKDYALAEESFRAYLRKYPSDRLVGEANYWLGESMFQRQRYREAAETFLTVSTKFEKSSKAPDALLRLGQSLAALKEKEAACATFIEVGRKYPHASPSVRQGVEREQKRAGC